MDAADELLLLAHGLSTIDDSVRELTDLADLGVSLPHRVLEGLRKHRTAFAQLWWQDVHANPVWHDDHLDQCVAEAKEWVIRGQARLAELREGRSPA